VLLPVNFPKPPNVATVETALDASLEKLLDWDIAPENPARMHKAGIIFALCSHGLSNRADFLKSVRKAVARGLDPDAALAALTTVPARLFGIDADLGTIGRGKLASFVVADGDLFAKKTRVLETWVNGQRFEFDPPKNRIVAGEWSLAFGDSKGKPKKLLLSISESNDKLKAKIRPDQTTLEFEKAVKLSRIGLKGVRASGTFTADEFGTKGIAQFTFVVEADDTNASLGHIIWPDGQRSTLSATRTESDQNKSSDDNKASHDDQDSEDPEADTGDGVEDASQPASFAVNFPLGAFGRSQPPQPQHVVFRNATVWTCAAEGVLKKTSVLIGDGKILAIGKRIDIPDGTIEIDAKGRHLTPGIIDCHTHMGTDGGVNEGAQAVTAEVRIGDFVDCNDITIYRHLAGGVTSANILHGSANPIGGQNQVIKLRWGALGEDLKFAEAPAGIKFALGENVKQSNWGDDYTTRYPQTRMGVEQLMRDEFETAKEYVRGWDRWKKTGRGLPPRRDLELDAIAEILAGKRWIHCHSYRQDEILALIRVLDDYGITIGTFQHILEGYKVADEMAKHGAMGSAFSDWWAYKFEVYDAIPYDGALMHDAGVVVSFNSDDRELARHLNQEAAKAVKYGGLSPAEALKFVTLNPAKQLRIDQYVGSIEVGKHADLALWSGPPLSNFSRCEQSWVDGRKYFDRAEDAIARKTVADMRTKLVQKILASGEKMQQPGEDDKNEDDSRLWPREDVFCFGNGLGNGHECVGNKHRTRQ
jgi:imidazolonepropionase-like amidohydrolase